MSALPTASSAVVHALAFGSSSANFFALSKVLLHTRTYIVMKLHQKLEYIVICFKKMNLFNPKDELSIIKGVYYDL